MNQEKKGSKFVKALSNLNWDEEDKLEAYHDFHDANVRTKKNQGLIKRFLKKWKAWNGPFTKPGSYIDFSEVHPVQIAVGSVGLTYVMHEVFATIYFGMAFKAVYEKYVKENCTGLMCQIAEELHYYLFSGLATAGVMEYMGYNLPTLSVRFIELIKIFIGV
jgi:hypothetical protein